MQTPVTTMQVAAAGVAEPLFSCLLGAAPEPAHGWLAAAIASISAVRGAAAVGPVFAGAARRLREVPFELSPEAARALGGAGISSAPGWDAARAARTALLVAATAARPPDQCAELVARLFRTGDNAERIALLGALSLLPEPPVYLGTAIDACRTNVVDVFESIACENPYPARCFPDAAFNQMVLKAVFLGVSIARIANLAPRVNDELVRMAADYARERRSAGRAVPADVETLCGRGLEREGA